MNTFDYDPYGDLQRVFQSPRALKDLPDLLLYINGHKLALNELIHKDIASYNTVQSNNKLSTDDISELVDTIQHTQTKSIDVQLSISSITTEISKLDNLKKNLTLSMNIFKRLQILSYSINELNQLLKVDYNYKDIYNHLNNIKDLLLFFKPYKSIDEINKLTLVMHRIEVKLVDNIYFDFEEILVHNKPMKEMRYACLILELIDTKQPDKLLNWFYNLQLKEIKLIFNNQDEAGSLENLNRRFIYFNNVFNKVKNDYKGIFPDNWNIQLELAKLFCEITKEDVLAKLQQTNKKVNSDVLLNCLNITLEFENKYNTLLETDYFTKVISKIFEPYLSVWISEQDKYLNSKMIEFFSVPKIPSEFQSTDNFSDFLNILKINSIPNISNSSIELFNIYQKLLIQILKISNGKILIDLSNLFNKYLNEYHSRILLPILVNTSELEDSGTNKEAELLELIKYLTMLLNTGDYIINNIDDLFNKINNLIQPEYKDKFTFDNLKSRYLSLINTSTTKLVDLVQSNLKFSWRQFENNNWQINESSSSLSNYMVDFKHSLLKCSRVVLPLIIRESYIKNLCNKIVELIIRDFSNNLKLIKPISILSIEQILNDIKDLKAFMIILPNYSNANFEGNDPEKSKYYENFVNSQFGRLETLLNLLLTPTLPVENLVENYFKLIKDKSLRNFKKFLNLKNLTVLEQRKYVESFNLQMNVANNDLIEESPILAIIHDESTPSQISTPVSTNTSTFVSSPVEDNKPKLKINNLEKNLRELAMNSENNINKINENFKNFGKLFRKDNHTD